MSSPIPSTSVTAQGDQVIGGKYLIKDGTPVTSLLRSLHKDRKVWGDDVDDFKPERFLDGNFQKLPPNSWKPFGNGMRACIGRGFAEQEMIMNIALTLQRFQLELADPNYELELKSALTIKPWNFRMKARRRPGKSLLTGVPGGIPSETAEKHKSQHERAHPVRTASGAAKRVSVFYGGETGTCESLAQALSESAPDGITVDIKSLDAATEHLPEGENCIIITSSYEGKPPGNAKKFVSWLEQLEKNSGKLPKVRYAVYGVGNSDWAATFHRIPKLVDETIDKLGGERITEAGYSNVKEDLIGKRIHGLKAFPIFVQRLARPALPSIDETYLETSYTSLPIDIQYAGPWENWSEKLLQTLAGTTEAAGTSAGAEVSVEHSKIPKTLGGEEMNPGIVIANYELADNSAGPAKRHIDLRLPEGSTYQAGDYLVVQPRNPQDSVRRVMTRFGLSETDVISVKNTKKKFLPTEPTSVEEFLLTSVELATPITKRQLATLAELAKEGSEERKHLQDMQEDSAYQSLLKKRYSVLDVLEEYSRLEVSFGVYVDMLQALVPRQYSISSSPLHPENNPGHGQFADICSLTYDVHTSSALSGHGTFHGVASNYLGSRRPGDRISCFVRPTNVGFRMPSDTETPLILVAAGTGIAPMRAFLQERAAIKNAGVKKLGPAVLFFGCRNEHKDFIYKAQLEEWQKQGIVEVKTAFSQPDSGSKKYVNEVIEENEDKTAELFLNGGKIYLCGSAARLGKSTAEACKSIYKERTHKSAEEAEKWLEQVKVDRYVSDVY